MVKEVSMMAELANCERCDRVFVKVIRTICEACYNEEEKMFNVVYNFIRKKENRSATLSEVHTATDVPEKTIIRFIKEGRLRTTQFTNLTYPCQSCGEHILEGKLCRRCVDKIESELEIHEREEARKKKREATYYSFEKDDR